MHNENRKEPDAPTIAIFCKLLIRANLVERDKLESDTQFAKRICTKFKLRYRDRVRQSLAIQITPKRIQKIKKSLLPLIDTKSQKAILGCLEQMNPADEKLYG